MRVPTHAFNAQAARSIYASTVEREGIYAARFAKGDRHVLIDVFNHAVTALEYAVALAEEEPALRRHLELASEAGVALYTTALNAGREIEVSLHGQSHRYLVEARNYRATFQGFVAAMHVALLGQRTHDLKALAAMDLDRLKDASFTPSDEYAKRYALFLQKLHAKGENHLAQLLAVSDAISEPTMHPLSFDYALRIVGPQLNLLTSLLTDDAATFDAELAEALQLHAGYYTREPENTLDAAALTSIALSALKRLAITQGFAVTTTSGYLAEALL